MGAPLGKLRHFAAELSQAAQSPARADAHLPPRWHAAVLQVLRSAGAEDLPSHLLRGAAQADVRPGGRLPRRERNGRRGGDLPPERRGALFGAAQAGERLIMFVEDEQLAAFAPGLDAQFRARCVETLSARGQWSAERVQRAVDTGLERAAALGLSEERSVLGYILLAAEIALARPEQQVLRAVEAILGEPALPEWQRVQLAADYLRQFHPSGS